MATKQHCVFVCAAFFTLATHIATANYTADWAVEINEGGEGMAHTIARLYGFRNLGKIGGLENVYHFEKISPLNDTQRAESDLGRHLCSEPSVVLAEQQFQEEREVKSLPSSSGIHQPEGSHNFSVSIERAWNQSLSGCNVSVAVVDDLIEVNHTDLRSNFAPNISYDAFHRMGLVYEREQRYTKQGTTCSRIIASSSPMANESCVLGIAYKSNFGALRIFGYDKENTKRYATDITEAIALSYKREIIDIYSNCWGAPDTGADVSGPKTITRRILADGVTEGRDGKGSIFVWANGNGGPNDDCAADGYASSPYTISVGAIRGDGRPSEYDEPCSAKLTVAPVTNGIMRNTATDETECDIVLNGTSAAASMVSGIIALALEANPSLTWRDVQYLIVYTANPNLTNDTDNLTWNGAGRAVSRQYGFGVMDAEAMVTRARHWINVPPQLIDPACMPPNQSGKASKSAPFSTTLNYTGKISYLEHVVVVISISADPRGDIQIYLESPAGTNVTLLQNRPNDTEAGKYNKWPFMSVMFWGENPNGNWTLTISNRNSAVEANITVEKFEFHGVLYTPMVITRIPKHDCERGCAAEGFEYCDSCKNFRNAHTRECIDTCPPGYYKLDYCYNDESEPIEECESPLKYKIENECNINNGGCEQVCTYAYTSRKCSCENGYMLDANRKNCPDIDECKGDDNGCKGECNNTNGTYQCSEFNGMPCKDGYKLIPDPLKIKRECRDIKECDTDNGGCQHLCWELPGSFQCDCYPGYTLDSNNLTCTDVDATNTTHGCQDIGNSTKGTYERSCSDGYLLNADRRTCTAIDNYCEYETPLFTPMSFIPLVMKPSKIEGDDNISPKIDFPYFRVGCINFTSVYVGTNGYFTFGNFTGFKPFRFAQGNGLSLVAPFFIDIADTTDTSGTIKYEFHDNSTFEVAKSVNGIIRREKDPYFCGKRFLIASWEEVSPYSNPDVKITFQGILATDLRKTFAIFTYKCDGNSFPDKATVGYVTEDGMVSNQVTLQDNSHKVICNCTTEEYVNIVLDISECNSDVCKQE